MVRLRSEKWYGGDGQRRSRTSVATRTNGSRRLISMCFLLALVAMLMQKAADPSVVRNAFNAIGVPLDGPTATPQSEDFASSRGLPSNNSADQKDAPPGPWRITCRDLSDRIVRSFTTEQLSSTAIAWFSAEHNGDKETETSLESIEVSSAKILDSAIERFANLQLDPATASTDFETWNSQLLNYRDLWLKFIESGQPPRSSKETEPSGETPQSGDEVLRANIAIFHDEVSQSFDTELLNNLKDAAFWKPNETAAFFRLLHRAEQGGTFQEHQNAPTVSTLQLEAESAKLRGQLVSFRGEVYRIEASSGVDPFTQSERPFYKMWLRGEDRANQPISAYCSPAQAAEFDRLPEAGKSLSLAEAKPRINIWGWVGKRMAYQSQSGIEVAPTIFASHIELAAIDAVPPVADDPNVGWKFAQIALAAALASFVVVWLLRSGQSRLAPIRRKSLILLLCVTPHCTATGQDTASTAPWAQWDASDALLEIVQSPIDEAWQQDTLSELQTHATRASGTTLFPDGVLKTMRLFNQIGWTRTSDLQRLTSSWIELERTSFRAVAVSCDAVALTPTQLQWFQEDDLARLFRVEVRYRSELGSASAATAVVYCTQVPLLWLGQSELRQPVSISGFALAATDSDQPESSQADTKCILAEAPSWLLSPDTQPTALKPSLPPRLLSLGKSGWNLTNLNTVAANNQRPLGREESDAYYSLMRCVSNAAAKLDFSQSKVEPTEVLNSKPPKTGLPLSWNVRLVSGTVVEIATEDHAALGSDRYFQMNGFVDLGNRRLSYLATTDAGETREVIFDREFPITLVTVDSAMVPEDVAKGAKSNWEIGKYVEARGVLYRLWAFRSDLIESRGASSLQAAPLVVLASLRESLPPVREQGNPIGWFGGALCVVVLCLLALILYFASQKDTRQKSNPRPQSPTN